MKLNSNTVMLEEDQFKVIEGIVTKIASDNNVNDIELISIQLDPTQGVIKFKTKN